ncbi:MAG: ASCH domain-containing protein [Chloroflexi bacterium]|nr:ASCH domain-containing protein [Chloroflexota bacterium]
MSHSPETLAFWQHFLDSLPASAPRPQTFQSWAFGHDADVASRLAALVRQGVKTATSGLLWSYEAEKEDTPEVGGYSVITDWEGRPLCIIQTLEVIVRPFNEVGADIAWEEGEGDRSLEYWREVHWEFFAEECAQLGRPPQDDMPVVNERFRLVFDQSPDI